MKKKCGRHVTVGLLALSFSNAKNSTLVVVGRVGRLRRISSSSASYFSAVFTHTALSPPTAANVAATYLLLRGPTP